MICESGRPRYIDKNGVGVLGMMGPIGNTTTLASFESSAIGMSTFNSREVSVHSVRCSERFSWSAETSWTTNSADPAKVEKSVVTVRIMDSEEVEEGFLETFFLTVDFLGEAASMRGVLTKRMKFISSNFCSLSGGRSFYSKQLKLLYL